MTEAQRWAAIQARDPAADASFVYGVKTTGIYCRPTCKARLARRSNVSFYIDSTLADAAGFRACKRCRPELASFEPQKDIVLEACESIKNSVDLNEKLSLKQLASQASLTTSHFHRVFKQHTGLTPEGYRRLLQSGRSQSPYTPSDLPFDSDTPWDLAGGNTTTPSSDVSTPSAITRIEYSIRPWTDSFVLIGISDEQVRAVHVSDDPSDLIAGLQAKYPLAELICSDWSGTTAQNHTVHCQVMDALESPCGKTIDIAPSAFEIF